ncbi:MAG: type II toxin-antitoxin system RelE/ParE family toxin [Bacteroidota bacterium]
MKYKYVLLERAQLEYEDAVRWYAERSISAAENLIKSVEYSLKLICDNPYRWKNEYQKFHELGIHKFPYQIIYFIDERKNV